MSLLFVILIILLCVVLGFLILIQNPKGGGLAGNVAGFSNQFMGVKQTTDVLEKGSWIFAAAIAVLCLVSTLFLSGGNKSEDLLKKVNPNSVNVPAQPAPAPTPAGTPAATPSNTPPPANNGGTPPPTNSQPPK
jgi:preprotein translocase subunit SecG